MPNGIIHDVCLPFTHEQLAPHFSNEKHLDSLATSAIRNSAFVTQFGAHFAGMPITKEVRDNRQIEKDERFWTVCTLKSVFDAGRFADILQCGFDNPPPLSGFASWEECVGEKKDQELRFEVAVSSPKVYRRALRSRFRDGGAAAHLVRYVVDAGQGAQPTKGIRRSMQSSSIERPASASCSRPRCCRTFRAM